MHFLARITALFVLISTAWALLSSLPETQVLVMYDATLSLPEEANLDHLLEVNDKYKVSYVDYADDAAQLFLGEDSIYSHVVFLPSLKRSAAATGIVDKFKLLEFFNKGGNVLAVLGAESALPEHVRLFLNEAGIYPAPKGFVVEDHFEKVSVGASNVVEPRIIGAAEVPEYKGTAALVSNNAFALPLVKGAKTSFTASPKDSALIAEKTWTLGEQCFLAAAFQGLNSARIAWVGSEQLLNEDLVRWVFQEKGVLKLQFVEHYKADEPGLSDRTQYRIKNDVVYTAGVSEWKDGQWVPYVPATEDDVLQLSFKMLDPYQRLNLTALGPGASTENGPDDLTIFYVNFTTPDHHGMFTFELDYKRPGLTFIEDRRVVTVRHLANDEYKRSWDIPNSWLYLATFGTVIAAWFLFVMNFLYIGEKKPNGASAAKEAAEKKAEKK
ncbi:hypothetical protein C7M61_001900 [Candidozyma pseudohaemuli]|uniref:Dolichyl-diphosphooligosaccharide--protein glycosyltransferase subunit WBP1 n=1 Tax=Candidozyma pseudohaemuli TaxID=418784 RepID=A0A2P7YTK1_9ASCO|nr:hypothetical protein C7M61_001900 [[Candida] pseudohaemulonii]PSK39293.1 hypothetical protein C7M61_001900 [[Candida] pseudohaemulonii]